MKVNMSYTRELSLQFRNVIINYGIKKLPISFHEFPVGACGDASLLLGKYLDQMNLGQFDYVCGEIGKQSHAWLEQDGIIIDITADQFNDVTAEVIVTDNSNFHKKFKKSFRHPCADSFGNGGYVDIELLPAYYKIIKCLDEKYKQLMNDVRPFISRAYLQLLPI